jgi:phage/plasmid primase-like uncharacterized protein
MDIILEEYKDIEHNEVCRICGKKIYEKLEHGGVFMGNEYKDGTWVCMYCEYDKAAKKAEEIKQQTGKEICRTCYVEHGIIHYIS